MVINSEANNCLNKVFQVSKRGNVIINEREITRVRNVLGIDATVSSVWIKEVRNRLPAGEMRRC